MLFQLYRPFQRSKFIRTMQLCCKTFSLLFLFNSYIPVSRMSVVSEYTACITLDAYVLLPRGLYVFYNIFFFTDRVTYGFLSKNSNIILMYAHTLVCIMYILLLRDTHTLCMREAMADACLAPRSGLTYYRTRRALHTERI